MLLEGHVLTSCRWYSVRFLLLFIFLMLLIVAVIFTKMIVFSVEESIKTKVINTDSAFSIAHTMNESYIYDWTSCSRDLMTECYNICC